MLKAIKKEVSLRLTKDVVGKEVVDSKGVKVGKIKELIIVPNIPDEPNGETFPAVEGFITNKKFVPWNCVVSFTDAVVLNRRYFEIANAQIPQDRVFLMQQIIDEQLLDINGKHVGRVDDLALVYDVQNNVLRVTGIYSGIFVRVGIQKFYDIIPWPCVKKLKFSPPSALIVKLSEIIKHKITNTDKLVVFANSGF